MGEPVFVPKAPGAAEGEGCVLASVFDEMMGNGQLAIFDASRLEDGPLARAHLPHRMPVGFHSAWRPD